MRRILLLLAFLAIAPLMASGPAVARSRRLAVVVGVSNYGGKANLSNPTRDAQQMAATLQRLGFDVRLLRDGQANDIFATIAGLGLTPEDQFAFFFSGHGLTLNGKPSLVTPLRDGKHTIVGLTRLDAITALVETFKPATALYMLDACRSNESVPLPKDGRGLAAPPRTAGAFFAYAAAPGEVAYDAGRTAPGLSPFTFALSDELLVPNQDIGVVMRHVRERVAQVTDGRQLPWTEDALTGPLVLNEAPTAPELSPLWGRALKGEAAAERDLGLAYLDGQGVAMDIERGTALLEEAGRQNDVPALLALGGFELTRDRSALRPVDKARAAYEQAHKAGSAEAAYRLAELDRRAILPDARPSDATLALYREAAKAGRSEANARYLGYNLRFHVDPDLDRTKTIAALRSAGAAGDRLAAVELGRVYHERGSPDLDIAEGDFWLDRAARQGSTEALLEQAKDYGQGRGRPVDEPHAYALTVQAAERGDAEAMLFAGRMLQSGMGVASDRAAAVGWFRRAGEAGQHEAFADLGFAFEAGAGVDRNPGEAVAAYTRGAALDDPVSTRSLAVMYENGTGVRRNMDKAVAFYERASTLGDVRAKGSLAVLAGNGMLYSVPDVQREAKLLAEAVAGSDDADYMVKLAQMTEKGIGRAPDPAEAARLYTRAAALGNAEAASELAALTWDGKGVEKDEAKAVALWRKAAEAGDSVAYADLSRAARLNGTTEEDRREAGRWARRGAEAGQPDAMVMYGRDLLLGQEGFGRDVDGAYAWLAKALAADSFEAAEVLAAIPNDRTVDLAPADRDRAVLTLVTAVDGRGSRLAAEALQHVYKVENGFDITRPVRPLLVHELDGPQRGLAALALGLYERSGAFGKADPVAALAHFRMAAEAGEAQAWRQIGDLQRDRLVPGAAPSQAVESYRRGVEAGEVGAMVALAAMLRKGEGVPADAGAAFALLKTAAERNSGPAMAGLANLYDKGEGTPASPVEAERWYTRAAEAGDVGAEAWLADVLFDATPPAESDYTRSYYYQFRLGMAGDVQTIKSLGLICRKASLPRPVREHALFVLQALVLNKAGGDAGAVLDGLVADHVVTREGTRLALRE